MISVAGLVVLVPGLMGDVAQLLLTVNGKKPYSNIKINPPVEVVNKFNEFVNATPMCPRTLPVPSDVATEDAEYDHCKECQMGVFFKKNEEELECSYCSKIRKA